MLDTCAFSSPIIPINNFAVGALLTSTGHCRIAMLLVSITTMVMELHSRDQSGDDNFLLISTRVCADEKRYLYPGCTDAMLVVRRGQVKPFIPF
ncbi:hypothetical protein DDB_G0287669 [Dictyostelium discoideum AX4]|uniref:Uncharacterized protein n=1 Tax=Dictyostelium discoideum TaxID=44689 RepID=Q54K29_DICDI|nr:hypothetical protein DDB_G0287669 [Dictyostelium discoideum AX4]EAL63643.1 hypothetical protein DDB_G0287669 [Dictyostelium discoideum AX4]|eukprot:XP_637135.1 hypothetical protein DDB_G0287669 [Dictyostelium discoideum AX4]